MFAFIDRQTREIRARSTDPLYFAEGTRPPQVVLAPANSFGENVLILAQDIADRTYRTSSLINFAIPEGTFFHTNPSASVALEARQADDSGLPTWLTFNPEAGTFSGVTPEDFTGTLRIKVIARDSNGIEAEGTFVLNISEQDFNVERDGASVDDGSRNQDQAAINTGGNKNHQAAAGDGNIGEKAPAETASKDTLLSKAVKALNKLLEGKA